MDAFCFCEGNFREYKKNYLNNVQTIINFVSKIYFPRNCYSTPSTREIVYRKIKINKHHCETNSFLG